ncbi:MAG: FGGY family carbohydrate kinase [Evtepia gabavorous]
MTDYLLALDQGTTSSRAILFTRQGSVVSSAQIPFSQYYPQPGWVEHDPLELLDSQLRAAAQCVAQSGVRPGQIAGVGLANQRETALMWERETGKPVGRAIVWQCRRTAAFCTQLREQGYTEAIRARTGLLPDAYFSGTKYRWLLEHTPAPGGGRSGRAALRYGGQLAAVESHRGKGPCLGLLQLLPDHAL